MIKKVLCMVLCVLCLAGTAHAEEGRPIPDCLRFSVKTEPKQQLTYKTNLRRSYPRTALPAVDAEIAALIDDLAGRPALQPGKCQEAGLLDVTCRVQRSGESAMSFLVLAARTEDRVQTGVAFENRVFDMESGLRITLSDLICDTPDAHAYLAEEVCRQINAYYPALEADADALNALCQWDKLKDAAFSLTPAQLELHYPAQDLYEGRQTILHVRIPFRSLRPYLTEYGIRQTDNMGYQLAALTYDDGPAKGTTSALMDTLMAHGAGATFFVVGTRIKGNKDLLAREQDSGFSIGSHNYEHEYQERNAEKLLSWKDRFARELSDVTGTVPTLLRAPGGKQARFQKAGIGLPIFHWSISSSDADNDHSDQKISTITRIVSRQTKAGSIVLMHDINYHAPQYTRDFLDTLEERNILCVTLEDLFLHYGVPLEGDVLYYSCEDLVPLPY